MPTRVVAAACLALGIAALPVRSADEPVKHEGKTLDEWVAVMKNPKQPAEARRHAARVLGRFGLPAVPYLFATFRTGSVADRPVRGAAAGSLARIGGLESRVRPGPTFPGRLGRFVHAAPGVFHVRERLALLSTRGTVEEMRYVVLTAGLLKDPGQATPGLFRFLTSRHPDISPAVRDAFPELDPTVLVPLLLEQLKVGGSVGEGAANGLSYLGSAAKPALEPARRLLAVGDTAGARILQAIGPEAEPAVPDLIRCFAPERPSDPTAEPASDALVAVGKAAVPALLAELKSGKPPGRLWAVTTLGRIGRPDADTAAPWLLEIVEAQKPPELVDAAVASLASFPDKRSVPALLGLLASLEKPPADSTLRVRILDTLTEFGPKAEPALGAIVRQLADKKGSPFHAFRALLAIGPDAAPRLQPAMDFLTERLIDGDLLASSHAGEALHRVGPAVVTEMLKLFEVKEPAGLASVGWRNRTYILAARVLGQVGEPAKEAAPKLRELARLGAVHASVRAACAEALGRIRADPKADLPLLAELLTEGPAFGTDFPVSPAAALAIGSYGPAAKELVPLLLKVGRTEVPPFQESARVSNALVALPAVGAGATDAVPVLAEYLKRSNLPSVLNALAAYKAAAKPALPVVLRLLDASEPTTRVEVCKLLGAIGPDAKEALPDLRELTFDEEKNVRAAAREAIKLIEK